MLQFGRWKDNGLTTLHNYEHQTVKMLFQKVVAFFRYRRKTGANKKLCPRMKNNPQ